MRREVGLVGRRSELATIARLLSDDSERAVVVSGESGVGKTAIVEQVCASAVAEDWQVVRVLGVVMAPAPRR